MLLDKGDFFRILRSYWMHVSIVNRGDMVKRLSCGHEYNGDCIIL